MGCAHCWIPLFGNIQSAPDCARSSGCTAAYYYRLKKGSPICEDSWPWSPWPCAHHTVVGTCTFFWPTFRCTIEAFPQLSSQADRSKCPGNSHEPGNGGDQRSLLLCWGKRPSEDPGWRAIVHKWRKRQKSILKGLNGQLCFSPGQCWGLWNIFSIIAV